MASIYGWIWLTVLLPFLGFLANGLLALRRSESKARGQRHRRGHAWSPPSS